MEFLNVVEPADGSVTVKNELLNEPYHSMKGAVAESLHVQILKGAAGKREMSRAVRSLSY